MNVLAPVLAPRGIEAPAYQNLLARVKIALASATEISVPAWNIRPYPNQPRKYFDEAHIAGLAKSIDEGGQTTRGMIREKQAETRYELIDGECRWRGILRIPEERQPPYKADLIDADDDVIHYLIAGVANFNRRGHTATETMHAIEQFVSFELPMEKIAALLGIGVQWAEQMYGLRKLKPEVLDLLSLSLPKEKRLPVTAAIQISKTEEKFQLELAKQVLNKKVPLTRLRGEVVRVAQNAGSQIRVRKSRPGKSWRSFGKKINLITLIAEDAKDIVSNPELKKFINFNSKDTAELLRKVQDAKDSLSAIENKIRESRS